MTGARGAIAAAAMLLAATLPASAYAQEGPEPTPETKRAQPIWGYLGPGMALTIAGVTTLPFFVLASTGQRCISISEVNFAGGSSFSSSCSPSFHVDQLTLMTGATTIGHIAVGIGLIAKGAIGEGPPAGTSRAPRVAPLVGLGQLGVRGTF
jgi:hypothetical protein